MVKTITVAGMEVDLSLSIGIMDIDVCINPVNKIAKPWSLSKDDRLLALMKEHTPLNNRILILLYSIDRVEGQSWYV